MPADAKSGNLLGESEYLSRLTHSHQASIDRESGR
jgi:hypothetical protein